MELFHHSGSCAWNISGPSYNVEDIREAIPFYRLPIPLLLPLATIRVAK